MPHSFIIWMSLRIPDRVTASAHPAWSWWTFAPNIEKCSPFKKNPSSLSKRTVRIPTLVRTQSHSIPLQSTRLTTMYSFGVSGDHGVIPVKEIDWQISEFPITNGSTLLARTSFPSQIHVSSIIESNSDKSDFSDACTCVPIFNSACQLSFSFFNCVVCTNTPSSSI